MRQIGFSDAIDDALGQAMAADPRIILLGEDVRACTRVVCAFWQTAGAQHAHQRGGFPGCGGNGVHGRIAPGGRDHAGGFHRGGGGRTAQSCRQGGDIFGRALEGPLVVRTTCGGGYGDGGQHEQSLWGWLAHIPGLSVVVPSTPADAGGLMLAALALGSPVIFMEHKLISSVWLDFLGSGGRETVTYEFPAKEHADRPRKLGTAADWQSGRAQGGIGSDDCDPRCGRPSRIGSRRHAGAAGDFSRRPRPAFRLAIR